MSIATFTLLHVVFSLVGIATGIVVLVGMIRGEPLPAWTAVFLASTVGTSVTGFMFPFTTLLPSHIVGAISLVALIVALAALYKFKLVGGWRLLYVASAVLVLYLNVFVGLAQAFQKLPLLQQLAPTQSEPPFAFAQLVVLFAFAALGAQATRRFRPALLTR